MKYFLIKTIFFIALISEANSLFAQNLFFPTKRTKVVYDAFLKDEGRSSDEAVQYKHFTYTCEYIPLYNSKDLTIIKCYNFILYGVDKDALVNNTTDSSYLVIEDNCKYFDILICDSSTAICDTNTLIGINQFLRNEISVSVLKQKLKNPFLNSREDHSLHYDETFQSTLSTKRIHSNYYHLTYKSHNEHALYDVSSDKGFVCCNYHWGRIVTYEVSLKMRR